MISFGELARFENSDKEVTVVCIDGKQITGMPDSVEDEEESGINEPGITIFPQEGNPVIIGLSEILAINYADEKLRPMPTDEMLRRPYRAYG